MKERTPTERKSERELVVTRIFNGLARIVFEGWTKPEPLKRWWAPRPTGVSQLSCEADVRVGGRYRFEFGHEAAKPMAFFGRYMEVTPHLRLVWSNDESGDGAVAGMEGAMPEMFGQLDQLLVALGAMRQPFAA